MHAGQRDVELKLAVIANVRPERIGAEDLRQARHAKARAAVDAGKARRAQRIRRLRTRRDDHAARLDDAAFFACDLHERIAELRRVVK